MVEQREQDICSSVGWASVHRRNSINSSRLLSVSSPRTRGPGTSRFCLDALDCSDRTDQQQRIQNVILQVQTNELNSNNATASYCAPLLRSACTATTLPHSGCLSPFGSEVKETSCNHIHRVGLLGMSIIYLSVFLTVLLLYHTKAATSYPASGLSSHMAR